MWDAESALGFKACIVWRIVIPRYFLPINAFHMVSMENMLAMCQTSQTRRNTESVQRVSMKDSGE